MIIEREDDSLNLDRNPAIKAAAEEILVLQQIPYLMDRNLCEMPHLNSKIAVTERSKASTSHPQHPATRMYSSRNLMFDPGSWKKLRRYVTVNGQKIPTIEMAAGEVPRFRFIHAGQRELITLQLQEGGRVPAPGIPPGRSKVRGPVRLHSTKSRSTACPPVIWLRSPTWTSTLDTVPMC